MDPLAYSEKRRILTMIGERIAQGRSLTSITMMDDDVPTVATLWRWQRDHPELKTIIEDARIMALEKAVEEIIEIADEAPATKGGAAKAKVRIYARERQAMLMAPRRFKTVTDVTSGDKPIEAAPAVAFVQDNRMQALIQLAWDRKQKDLERQKLLDD